MQTVSYAPAYLPHGEYPILVSLKNVQFHDQVPDFIAKEPRFILMENPPPVKPDETFDMSLS